MLLLLFHPPHGIAVTVYRSLALNLQIPALFLCLNNTPEFSPEHCQLIPCVLKLLINVSDVVKSQTR